MGKRWGRVVGYHASEVRFTMTFLENQDVEVMDWPAKIPDMNPTPTEHIWDQMAIHIRDMNNPPTTQQQLPDAVMAAWDALRPKRLRSLLKSMPRRVCAVQYARGGHTRYQVITKVANDLFNHLTKN